MSVAVVAAANRNRIFIALDEMEHLPVRGGFTNRVRYAEARALGDSMVNNQDDNGRIRTYWIPGCRTVDFRTFFLLLFNDTFETSGMTS